jgi:hypothetical protein
MPEGQESRDIIARTAAFLECVGAPARGLRRSEAAALTMGRVERREDQWDRVERGVAASRAGYRARPTAIRP